MKGIKDESIKVKGIKVKSIKHSTFHLPRFTFPISHSTFLISFLSLFLFTLLFSPLPTPAKDEVLPIFNNYLLLGQETNSYFEEGIEDMQSKAISYKALYSKLFLNWSNITASGKFSYIPYSLSDSEDNTFDRIKQEINIGLGYAYEFLPGKLGINPSINYLNVSMFNNNLLNPSKDIYLHNNQTLGGIGINMDIGYRIFAPLMIKTNFEYYPSIGGASGNTYKFPESLNLLEIGGSINYDITEYLALYTNYNYCVFNSTDAQSPDFKREEDHFNIGVSINPSYLINNFNKIFPTAQNSNETRVYIAEIQNNVKIVKQPVSNWETAKLNVLLSDGDVIKTAKNSYVDIIYEDGKFIHIEEDSGVVFENSNTLTILKGRILTKIYKSVDLTIKSFGSAMKLEKGQYYIEKNPKNGAITILERKE